MDGLNYKYRFPNINEVEQPFVMVTSKDEENFQASIAVDDFEYLKSGRSMPANVADVIDLAVAVSAADRLSVCKDDDPNLIEVELPVRNPELLNASNVTELLKNILNWYTGDHWRFSFSARGSLRRRAELQQCLSLDFSQRGPAEVALWSGGLDALSGLYNRLLASSENRYILLGTGSSNIVHNGQKHTALSVERVKAFTGRTKLVRVPVKVLGTKDRPKNSALRARGFVYLLLGAACAYLEGQRCLNVYENGVGAINLPFRASEVGLDHARSVHPISLFDMGSLVSLLLGAPFVFRNPFLFSTKAQMCKALVEAGDAAMMLKTISCDRLRREHPMQCGLCSSCLLRRQALAVLGVEDAASYVATSARSGDGTARPLDTTHLKAMLFQVRDLRSLLSTPNPWDSLSRRYGTLTDTVDRTASQEGQSPAHMQERLLGLYGRYVQEWDVARPSIELRQTMVH